MKDIGNSEIEWIIQFRNNRPEEIKRYPEEQFSKRIRIEVYPEQNSLKNTEFQEDATLQKETEESLEEIAEACKEIKKECIEKLTQKPDEKQSQDLIENLKGIYKAILDFTKIIKKKKEDKEEKGE